MGETRVPWSKCKEEGGSDWWGARAPWDRCKEEGESDGGG